MRCRRSSSSRCRTAASATTRARWPPGWTCSARRSQGNYRDLLEAVSRHPLMGMYLSHLRNQKADARTGRVPDENYAREVMQLFSIGLVELNADGSARTSGSKPLETYAAADVAGLAKVFTGWSWDCPEWPDNSCFFGGSANGNSDPDRSFKSMLGYPQYHSVEEKKFLGTTIAAQTTVRPAGQPEGRARRAGRPPQRRALHRPPADPAPGHQQPQPALRGRGRRGLQGRRRRHEGHAEGGADAPRGAAHVGHRRQAARAGAQAVGLPARLRLHAPTPATSVSATPTTPAPRSARRRCARRRCSTSTVPATCRPAPRPAASALAVPELQIAHETTRRRLRELHARQHRLGCRSVQQHGQRRGPEPARPAGRLQRRSSRWPTSRPHWSSASMPS